MADTILSPMTIRLESAVSCALTERARKAGQEVADYAADVLAREVMPELQEISPDAAKRVQAELELKRAAIKFAVDETQRCGFDSDITLKTFQHIRTNERLCALYLRAIGNRPGDERGNPIKARINRNFGAAIKTAVGAVPQTANGNPLKAQVTGEFIFSYTRLALAPGVKNRG
jgi:hypothetical protein